MATVDCRAVYMFSVYYTGHLISMVEAAKRLLQCLNSISSGSISVHILLIEPKDASVASPLCFSYIQSFKENQNLPIHFHLIPFVEEFGIEHLRLYLPRIKAAMSASPSPMSGLIIDMFASDLIDVAKELNILTYIYHSSTATFLSLMFHLSSTQNKYDQVDFSELEEEICVPGLTPIPPLYTPSGLLDRKSYKFIIYHASRYNEANGIIINSNVCVESKAIEALVNGVVTGHTPGSSFLDIYPIGPVINFGETSVQEHKCLEWLDKQPAKSVLYLCFGSKGAFGASQVHQIAAGLEQSGHHFLWILRMPHQDQLSGPTDGNLEEILPEGFLERTKGKGMVWPSYAPQVAILSHQAIGGFVTHCGWNSVQESLWFGVPLIPLPLYAEQHLNAFQLANEINVAVVLKFDRKNNGFVTGKEFERAVKQLMDVDSEEGRRAQDKAEKLKSAYRNAVQPGGVSHLHLQKLARELGIIANA